MKKLKRFRPKTKNTIVEDLQAYRASNYKNNWKLRDWTKFCKMLMEEDRRFHLVPVKDWYKASIDDKAFGTVFGPYILRRDGEWGPIDIAPNHSIQGLWIATGCAYLHSTVCGYHSKSLIWPVLRLCSELERQYNRMVERTKLTQNGRAS